MVFGLFSKKKPGEPDKGIQKTIERATNKLAQQPDRWAALEQLKKDASEDALLGLCKRFSVTSMKAVEDEQEKHWVVDVLVSNGAAALPPLVRFMKTAEQLSFALRVLERVGDHDKVLEIADQLFASEPPGYVRMPERRIDLLRWFAEWTPATSDEHVSRLAPYVIDFDENARFAAIDGMAGHDGAKIGPPLIAALLRPEEESNRIKRRIAEILAVAKAPLGEHATAVAAALGGPLAGDFRVDGGVIKQR